MFEDDEDEDDDFIESDLNKWFYAHETDLPRELVNDSERHSIDLAILYRTYGKIVGPLTSAINLLLPKHYPRLGIEMRPPVVEKIEEIAKVTASSFLFELFKLVYDQKSGVTVREKYTYFDDYIKYYGRPKQPPVIKEAFRYAEPDLTDEEWEERKKELRIEVQERFDKENTPRVEFINAVQSVLLVHYAELETLNPDEWIIYAMLLNSEYREYQDRCWLVKSFIDYGLPLQDLELSAYDLTQKIVYIKAELREVEHRQRTEQRKNEG